MEALEASQDEVSRLQELIDQLLILSRIEGKSLPIVEVNVVDLVRSRMEIWEPLAEEKDVSIHLSMIGDFHGRAAEGALEQIIDNFVDNALSVAPQGSVIDVSVSNIGEQVVVLVQDSGPGMSPDELAMAFERFWRAPRASSTEGTGLGLSIVRQLALASGAEVTLRNRDDGQTGIIASVALSAA